MKLPITVIDGTVPALLGRDWLSKIRLNWTELFSVDKNVHKLDIEDESRLSRSIQWEIRVFKGF